MAKRAAGRMATGTATNTATLADSLLTAPRHARFVADCAAMADAHFDSLRGLKGIGLRTGLSMLKAGRPNAMPEAVERLLPDIVRSLEPEYQAWRAEESATGFADFLLVRREQTLEAIVSSVDERIGNSSHATMRSMYATLRGGLSSEIDRMLPALAQLLEQHVA